MKKVLYTLLAASLTLLISCEKGKDIDTSSNEPAIEEVSSALTGNKITFDVEMDFGKETMATLSGLNINWQSGDHIGVATNNDATIRVYEVTPKSGKTGTVTIDEVVGATEYYALFKGSLGDGGAGVNSVDADDFSMITFDTGTKTFSGLTVGIQQVASGSLESYLWYSNGYPLSMAGKTSGDRNSLIMKPCLALVKLQIASASVPADYFYKNIPYESSYSITHNHYYSAVRGFNLYQKGGSTIYSSGDYDVQVNNDGSLTTTSVGTQKEYRQISQSTKLAASTDYLMCLIPGGEITSFQIDFLGYKDNEGALSWDAVYTMRNPIACTVSPGDYFNFGTLNPLGLKKAQLEAADEVADEASAAAPITIDGTMTDWNPATNALLTADNYVAQTGNSRFKEIKVAYDNVYVYVYIKRNRVYSLWGSKQAYFYLFFDTDNDSSNGTAKDGYNYDYGFFFYPFGGTQGADEASAIPGWASSPASSTKASDFTNGGGISIEFAGTYDASDVELEFKILRTSLGIEKDDVINIAAYGNKSADSVPYTRVAGFEIKK